MFAEKTIEILKDYVKECHQGNVLAASKALCLPNDTLSRWLKGEREPGLFRIGTAMDIILQSSALPEHLNNIKVVYITKETVNDTDLHEQMKELKETLLVKQGEINALERLLSKREASVPYAKESGFIEEKTA